MILQEALAKDKTSEANEIHGTRSKPWSTPHAHKYEHVRCVRSDMILIVLGSVCSVF